MFLFCVEKESLKSQPLLPDPKIAHAPGGSFGNGNSENSFDLIITLF